MLDFPAFWAARGAAAARPDPPRRPGTAVLHPTCTLVKTGGLPDLLRVARAHSAEVRGAPPAPSAAASPATAGFLVPELTASATAAEAAEVRGLRERRRGAGFYSTCRTCEIGMSRAVGRPYRSLVASRARGRRACLSGSWSGVADCRALADLPRAGGALGAREHLPARARRRRGRARRVPRAARRGLGARSSAALLARQHRLLGGGCTSTRRPQRGRGFFEPGWGRKLLPPEAHARAPGGLRAQGTAGIFVSRFLPGLRAAVTPFAGVVGLDAGARARPRGDRVR